jgi:hypothetical protein
VSLDFAAAVAAAAAFFLASFSANFFAFSAFWRSLSAAREKLGQVV